MMRRLSLSVFLLALGPLFAQPVSSIATPNRSGEIILLASKIKDCTVKCGNPLEFGQQISRVDNSQWFALNDPRFRGPVAGGYKFVLKTLGKEFPVKLTGNDNGWPVFVLQKEDCKDKMPVLYMGNFSVVAIPNNRLILITQ
jgi:hypothetical protein